MVTSSAALAPSPSPEQAINDCVHCGFCLPSCPTYVLWGEEMDSPRGRIHLASMVAQGAVGYDEALLGHFDNCLGCMGCLTSCPSGVAYDVVLEAARAQIEETGLRSPGDQRFRKILLSVFPERGRLMPLAVLLYIIQKTGLQALFRGLGLTRWLPPSLRALEALTPPVRWGAHGVPEPSTVSQARLRVAMLEGCVQSVFFRRARAATEAVLAAENIEVVRVKDQGCCGALELHVGAEASARERAKKLIERFSSVDADYIATDAAGCGSTLKTVHRLFSASDPFRKKAEAFAVRVRDVLELVAGVESQVQFRPLKKKVAYHDACHLAHAQAIREAPRTLLRRIPELTLLEVPEGEVCCGSAGVYNILNPEPAEALGRRKADHIQSVAPDLVAAANPGCTLQLQRFMPKTPCVHPMELLAEALETRPDSPS